MSEGGRRDNWVLFRLTDSVIVVGQPGSVEGKTAAPPVALGVANVSCAPDACQIAGAAVPADFEGTLYALQPRSKDLIETRVTPSYQLNSLRLKALLIEAKDHRLEAINTVGEIAAGGSKLLRSSEDNLDSLAPKAPKASELRTPFTIDLAEARCESEASEACVSAVVRDPAGSSNGKPKVLPDNPTWTYQLTFLDNPKAAGFIARADVAKVHGAMVGSVCRPVRLDLFAAAKSEPTVSLRVLVADPDWLETSPFPTKGAMNFQPLCGIDVQADTVATVGTDALAAAFFSNVAAVRAAQKK